MAPQKDEYYFVQHLANIQGVSSITFGMCLEERKEVWSSGALEACCRCADVDVWSSGALEALCGRADVEA